MSKKKYKERWNFPTRFFSGPYIDWEVWKNDGTTTMQGETLEEEFILYADSLPILLYIVWCMIRGKIVAQLKKVNPWKI